MWRGHRPPRVKVVKDSYDVERKRDANLIVACDGASDNSRVMLSWHCRRGPDAARDNLNVMANAYLGNHPPYGSLYSTHETISRSIVSDKNFINLKRQAPNYLRSIGNCRVPSMNRGSWDRMPSRLLRRMMQTYNSGVLSRFRSHVL